MKKALLIFLFMSLILVSCAPNDNQQTSNEIVLDNKKNIEMEESEHNETNEEKSELDEKYKYAETVKKPIKLEITSKPIPSTWLTQRGRLDKIPEYNPKDLNAFQIDFRGYDLSHLDIGEDRLDVLREGSFNTATKWPKNLPKGFNPVEIMEIGKNPGLNVRELHKQGITGKGVGIAIIDQKLLVEHNEYKDQLKLYEEINIPDSDNQATLHGAAVASIAVGKTVGVAPDADLLFLHLWKKPMD